MPPSPARTRATKCVAASLLVTLAACSASAPEAGGVPEAGADPDDAGVGAGGDADADARVDAWTPTGKCADAFGSALTAGFGRIDGTVYAVQRPSDTACVLPNADHVIVQVLMNGSVYRLVANVESDRAGADPKIRVATLPHVLPAPAFAEGWHVGASLDYVASLGAHSDAAFAPMALADAVTTIASEVKVGELVSVYGTSGDGRPESAHLIHRNKVNQDGAIVVSPMTSPRFLCFHFDGQVF